MRGIPHVDAPLGNRPLVDFSRHSDADLGANDAVDLAARSGRRHFGCSTAAAADIEDCATPTGDDLFRFRLPARW
jgi:hypothetical protein